MKTPGPASTFFILIWFLLLVILYVIVTVPAREPLTSIMPSFFWNAREMIYPLFYSSTRF